MEITGKYIDDVYDELRNCKDHLFKATGVLADTQTILERKKLEAIADGTITGKNQPERDACAYKLLEAYYANVEVAQNEYDEARYEHDLAALEVERMRLIVRLLEVVK